MLGATLAGACVTGVAFFLVEGTQHATHAELRETLLEAKQYTESSGPYIRDKGTIFTRLESIDESLRKIQALLERNPR